MEISKKDKNITVFSVLYLGIASMSLSEEGFIEGLCDLYTNGFRTYHIDGFDEVLNYLQNNNFDKAYIFSMLLDRHNTTHKNLTNIFTVFPAIKPNILKNAPLTIKKLKEYDRLLKAFDNFDEITDADMTCFFKKNLFEENHTNELINRLHQLVNQFGLDQLNNMGIRLVKISDIRNMSYSELRAYYKECITIIKHTIMRYIELCTVFKGTSVELDRIIK